MKRRLVFRILRFSLIPFFLREIIQRRNVTIIFYHDPSPELLAAHLSVLRRKYNLISLRQFVNAHRQHRIDKLPPKSLVITFDDGHAGNYRLRLILEEARVPVTIFLCSGIVDGGSRMWFKHASGDVEALKRVPDSIRLERLRNGGLDRAVEECDRDTLSKDEIRELAHSVDFQSHTVSHPILPNCSSEKAEEEIFESKHSLERDYGFDIYAISYPNGDYSNREVAFAERYGYHCALTADSGFNSQKTHLFQLKRMGIDDADGIDELLVKTSGLWGWLKAVMGRKTYGYMAVVEH